MLKPPGSIAKTAGCSNALFICKVIHLDSNSGWGRLSTLPCCDYTNSLRLNGGNLIRYFRTDALKGKVTFRQIEAQQAQQARGICNRQSMQCHRKFHAQTLLRLTAVLAFALVMMGTVTAQVAPPVGPYGFVLNATFNLPFLHGGAAIGGLMNFDGAGNVSGPYVLEMGSGGANPKQSIAGSFTGTYSSNPDGTGTISMALDNGDNLTLIMVIDNHGRGLQLAATSWCFPGPVCGLYGAVVSGVGEAVFNGGVHPIQVGFLNGAYGLHLTKSAPTPATSIEVWNFDGAGNVTLSGTPVQPCRAEFSSGLTPSIPMGPAPSPSRRRMVRAKKHGCL